MLSAPIFSVRGPYVVVMSHRTPEAPDVAMVDPRAPRFGQIITMTGLGMGVVLREPLLVLAVAVALNAAVLSGWRLDLYGVLWRHGMTRIVGMPDETEPASPHRFARLMGAAFTAIATVLLYAAPLVDVPGLVLAGYGVAALVALLAGIAGIGDYCVGCKLYRQVSFFRRLGVV
jgi:hypothetical protein